ncbi:hypothetical protein F7734_58610 [Scytonema sp. UIC 10036]|nr:hypothetical protein [Scytonema sp. UIC 10036]
MSLPFALGYWGIGASRDFNLQWFVIHYSLVSVIAYLASWVVMRLLFPRWRFRGGVWIGRWPKG